MAMLSVLTVSAHGRSWRSGSDRSSAIPGPPATSESSGWRHPYDDHTRTMVHAGYAYRAALIWYRRTGRHGTASNASTGAQLDCAPRIAGGSDCAKQGTDPFVLADDSRTRELA